MAIKVLLWQTIDKLGKRGEQVSVADGYARNYLFPRRLATPATEGASREFKASARKAEKVEQSMKKEYSDVARRVGETQLSVEMLANNEGILFGSVTPSLISDSLKRIGLDVAGNYILIEAPIKTLGQYTVTVRFHPEVQSKLKLSVVRSGVEQAVDDKDEENPFAKGISVDEAEKGDPKMRGKRPKKQKGGEGGDKKDGAKGEGAAKGDGAAKAAAPAEGDAKKKDAAPAKAK